MATNNTIWTPFDVDHTPRNRELLIIGTDGEYHIAYWDAYYAEGGRGYTGGCGWVTTEAEQVRPVKWCELPPKD